MPGNVADTTETNMKSTRTSVVFHPRNLAMPEHTPASIAFDMDRLSAMRGLYHTRRRMCNATGFCAPASRLVSGLGPAPWPACAPDLARGRPYPLFVRP